MASAMRNVGVFDPSNGTFTISLQDFVASQSQNSSNSTAQNHDEGMPGSSTGQPSDGNWIIEYDIGDDDGGNPNELLPPTVDLTGTVYDFQSRHVSGGHPDFQRAPSRGFGHYTGMVMDELDSEFKPVFGSSGFKVTSQWRDSEDNNIIGPKLYIASRPGDQGGNRETQAGGALTTASNFSQWFRETPGVNLTTNVPITLRKQGDTNLYVFDDRLDPIFANQGGFFPIDNTLYGTSGNDCSGRPHNFHFTFELPTGFVYKQGTGQQFTFIGDDDVWVFIDGKLVIDLGGVHGPVRQTIELDRLTWLENNHSYDLRFFFAERHECGSNFRIETTIALRMIGQPPVTSLAD